MQPPLALICSAGAHIPSWNRSDDGGRWPTSPVRGIASVLLLLLFFGKQ